MPADVLGELSMAARIEQRVRQRLPVASAPAIRANRSIAGTRAVVTDAAT